MITPRFIYVSNNNNPCRFFFKPCMHTYNIVAKRRNGVSDNTKKWRDTWNMQERDEGRKYSTKSTFCIFFP